MVRFEAQTTIYPIVQFPNLQEEKYVVLSENGSTVSVYMTIDGGSKEIRTFPSSWFATEDEHFGRIERKIDKKYDRVANDFMRELLAL